MNKIGVLIAGLLAATLYIGEVQAQSLCQVSVTVEGSSPDPMDSAVNSKCKVGDVLYLNVFPPRTYAPARYCNFDKSVVFTPTGQSASVTCIYAGVRK